MAFLLLILHCSSLLIIAAYHGFRLAQNLTKVVKLSVSFIDSLSFPLPEIFFLESYLNYGDGEENKAGFLSLDYMMEVSLE